MKVKAPRSFLALIPCLLFLSYLQAAGQTNTSFRFVQISDTHFGTVHDNARAEKVVNEINALPMPIKCVVLTGDITKDGLTRGENLTNGLAILSKLKAPMHMLPGNHDVSDQKPGPDINIYTNSIGNLVSKAEYDGVTFIFAYTEPLAGSATVEGYDPLKRLESMLKDARGKPVIVFHHTPSVDDFYNNELHEGWKKDMRERWETLLNAYNVKAVIAGHFHRDEFHWLGNVPMYVCSATAGYWGRQTTFRIYEYKDGKLSYSTQYVK